MGRDSGLLCWLYCQTTRSHAACEPGVLLVTLQASSGSAGMDSQCMSGALFVYNILAFFAGSALMILVLLHV